MLALTRQPRDGLGTIVAELGDATIRFTIVYVEGGQVRVAVDASKEVEVIREELLDAGPSEIQPQ